MLVRKIAIAGVLVLVVLGCVLAAGCTSTSSPEQRDVITVTNDDEFHHALADSGDKTVLVSYDLDLNTYNKKFSGDFKQQGVVTQTEDATAILNTNGHKLVIASGKTLSPHAHMITDDGTFKNTETSHNTEILSFLGEVALDSDSTVDVYENLLTGGKNVRTGEGLGIVDITFRYNGDVLQSNNVARDEASTFLPKGSTEKIVTVTDTSKTNGLDIMDTITVPEGTILKITGKVGCEGIYTILDGNIEISNYNDTVTAYIPANSVLEFAKNSKVTYGDGTGLIARDTASIINNGVITVKKNVSFILEDGAQLTNNGEFTVEEGAKYVLRTLARLINNGNVSGI